MYIYVYIYIHIHIYSYVHIYTHIYICIYILFRTGHTATQLKSGDYFGEMAFIATCKKFLRDKDDSELPEQAIRVADVVATAPCRMLEFSVKVLQCVV